jgi:hypothetical protein
VVIYKATGTVDGHLPSLNFVAFLKTLENGRVGVEERME